MLLKARLLRAYSILSHSICASLILAGVLFSGQAQSVVIDSLSTRGGVGSENIKIPLHLAVEAGAQPAAIQFEVTFETQDLKLVNVLNGPSAAAANKNSQATFLAANRLQVIVEGRTSEFMPPGIITILEFQNLALSPKLSDVSVSATRAIDSQSRVIPSSGQGSLVVLNEGIRLPECPLVLQAECRGNQLVIKENTNPTHELLFAQMATGIQSRQFGGYETALILSNLEPSKADVLIEFFGQDGLPLTVRILGNLDNAFRSNIAGNGITVIETSSSSLLSLGWIRVRSQASIGGSILYSHQDETGQTVSQTGILASTLRELFEITVDTRRDMNLGLAIANPNAASITLNLRLFDQSGVQKGERSLTLPPLGQVSMIASQIFPAANLQGFTGKIRVTMAGQGIMAATTLIFSSDLRLFASLPVI